MISIENLYKRTQEDLARKGKGGYTSTDEFNRDIADAQNVLSNFYVESMDLTGRFINSLSPFIKEKVIVLTNGTGNMPTDYKKWLDASLLPETDGTPDLTVRQHMDFVRSGEEYLTLKSPIRKPNADKEKAIFSFVNDKIRVWGANSNRCYLKYVAQPPTSVRGYTLNVTTDREEYDPTTTVDLIWKPQDEVNLRDIILLYKGIQIRESEIIQWLQAVKQMTPT